MKRKLRKISRISIIILVSIFCFNSSGQTINNGHTSVKRLDKFRNYTTEGFSLLRFAFDFDFRNPVSQPASNTDFSSNSSLNIMSNLASYYKLSREPLFQKIVLTNGLLLSDENKIDQLTKNPSRMLDPWQTTEYPLYGIRRLGYENIMHSLSGYSIYSGLRFTLNNLPFSENNGYLVLTKSQLLSFLTHPPSNLKWGVAERSDFPLRVPEEISQIDIKQSDLMVANSKIAKRLACFGFSPTGAKTCEKMVEEILSLMRPTDSYSGGSITAIPVIEEVLKNPLYADGAAKAAIKIMTKIDSIKEGNHSQDFGDLFTDIYQSFQEVIPGGNKLIARDMTWKLLALYSSCGPNTKKLFGLAAFDVSSARTLMAVQVIAVGMNVLDSKMTHLNRLYSLPKNIKIGFEYGKPYHFWMSAFLAHEMNRRHNNTDAASAAAALAEVGYQAFSQTNGRYTGVTSVGVNPTGDYANLTKIDLSIAFAGAAFGALDFQNNNQPTVDLNNVIQKSFKNSLSVRPLNESEVIAYNSSKGISSDLLKPYIRWVQYIRPISIFKSVKAYSQYCERLSGGIFN